MFLLVPAHPGFPGQIPQSRKTVVCCVCVCVTAARNDAVAVASAGSYANHLYLAPDRKPCQYHTTQFLQATCPSCRQTNSVKALKANVCSIKKCKYVYFQSIQPYSMETVHVIPLRRILSASSNALVVISNGMWQQKSLLQQNYPVIN